MVYEAREGVREAKGERESVIGRPKQRTKGGRVPGPRMSTRRALKGKHARYVEQKGVDGSYCVFYTTRVYDRFRRRRRTRGTKRERESESEFRRRIKNRPSEAARSAKERTCATRGQVQLRFNEFTARNGTRRRTLASVFSSQLSSLICFQIGSLSRTLATETGFLVMRESRFTASHMCSLT